MAACNEYDNDKKTKPVDIDFVLCGVRTSLVSTRMPNSRFVFVVGSWHAGMNLPRRNCPMYFASSLQATIFEIRRRNILPPVDPIGSKRNSFEWEEMNNIDYFYRTYEKPNCFSIDGLQHEALITASYWRFTTQTTLPSYLTAMVCSDQKSSTAHFDRPAAVDSMTGTECNSASWCWGEVSLRTNRRRSLKETKFND